MIRILVVAFCFLIAVSGAEPQRLAIETSEGRIEVEVWPDVAPQTVENFVGLATGTKAWKNRAGDTQTAKPYYDNLTFHRVIPQFMIQGGCQNGDGGSGPGYTFADEING